MPYNSTHNQVCYHEVVNMVGCRLLPYLNILIPIKINTPCLWKCYVNCAGYLLCSQFTTSTKQMCIVLFKTISGVLPRRWAINKTAAFNSFIKNETWLCRNPLPWISCTSANFAWRSILRWIFNLCYGLSFKLITSCVKPCWAWTFFHSFKIFTVSSSNVITRKLFSVFVSP